MAPLHTLASLAERQHGVFGLSQAVAAGVADHALRRLVDSGYLSLVQREVFAVSGCPPTWEQAVMTAVISAGPAAVASHRTAARVWGLASDRGEAQIEITLPRWHRAVRAYVVHESRDIPPEDRTACRGIPISTPARTVLDLAAVAPGRVEAALDAGLRAGLFDLAGVASVIGRLARRGRQGVPLVRGLVEARRH